MREFLFARAPWITEAIDAMLKATPRKRKREDDNENTVEADAEDDDGEDEADLELTLDDDDTNEQDEREPVSAELSELEKQINSNVALHCKPGLNTRVRACKICGIRLLDFAMRIHCHESHSVIVEDADGPDENVTMK
ncbi:hypothetical protein ACHAXR_003503 [Thalassiosira sp. AJA248-18]